MSEPSFNLRRGSVTTLYEITPVVSTSEPVSDHDISNPPIKAFNRSAIMWIVAIIIMCYHQMAFASLLPIYLLDDPRKPSFIDLRGGLGYTVHDVGTYMSVSGVIALVIQATIFPVFVGRVGVWKSLVSLLILCPITYIIVPLLSDSVLPAGVYAVLTLQNFFMIIIYPCLLIALKNATPSSLVLGKVNGLAMSACSGARTVAPPLAGVIYSASGSGAAWWSIAAVAAVGAFELCWIARPKDDADVVVENVLRRKSTAEPPTNQRPIPEEIILYCVGDVMCLPELRDRFWKGADGWRDLVNEETKKRVAASQKSEYQPHGLDRTVAPWTEDQNRALDKWNYVPPPCDYFDEDWFDEDWFDEDWHDDRGDNDFEDWTRAPWQGPPS